MSSNGAAELSAGIDFGEKGFYLNEFRKRTLAFTLPLRVLDRGDRYSTLAAVVRELLRNETRVLLLFGSDGRLPAEQSLRRLQRRLGPLIFCEETLPLFPQLRGQRGHATVFGEISAASLADAAAAGLSKIWGILRHGPLFVGVVEDGRSLLGVSTTIAQRFGIHKLVLVEPEGGVVTAAGRQLSFMNEPTLSELLRTGEAEWAGLAHRRELLAMIRAVLLGGVGSVNLCSLPGLPRELFTYEGSGTLFTLGDYCRVERLRIDDFEEVERLIERGQREGFLKLRNPEEIGEILLTGYGAAISAHHLAGVCALVTAPYAAERAGEISSLYTITRFKGEGAGGQLVRRVLSDARELGLAYVFACTTEERAQGFFERQGFRRVSPEDVPASKWEGYDDARRAQVAVYRVDLGPPTA